MPVRHRGQRRARDQVGKGKGKKKKKTRTVRELLWCAGLVLEVSDATTVVKGKTIGAGHVYIRYDPPADEPDAEAEEDWGSRCARRSTVSRTRQEAGNSRRRSPMAWAPMTLAT